MALTRSTDNKVLAGVCGGLAEYLEWDATLLRLAYALVTLFSAAFPGVVIYLLLWLLMPPGDKDLHTSNLELK